MSTTAPRTVSAQPDSRVINSRGTLIKQVRQADGSWWNIRVIGVATRWNTPEAAR